ncbi:concanavalin A-like lectin/glucanase domain-containing protein [Lasiosphaeria miniovina]|uniref:Concanavalin A-like lectin/glucanase domain-containing protein n=1 Tax=Lasiosphaeria miniovina TaxID=1954250 RepID=A0AA40E0Z5_9PEZI|nr:concanavalin A-like lectin/glucanase domain-containing protein [Lasiosphaeria miniovina]KAK0722990.1 concanavalin A-like lectin/glucanase domain-containing protein [Lasiosphaeria miniovina]
MLFPWHRRRSRQQQQQQRSTGAGHGSHSRKRPPTPTRSSPVRTLLCTITSIIPMLLAVTILPSPARADCECGYSATTRSWANRTYVFTDLVETDFARLGSSSSNNISADTDWARQVFNLSRARARGEYGEMFALGNVVDTAGAARGGDEEEGAALQLVVGSQLVDGMVPVAELDTRRLDLFWGTFRASMKLPRTPGTCAAFFWYFNDTQEIDMEFLTKDFDASNNSFPVNLVLQSAASAARGYDAAQTGDGSFVRAQLGFDPTAGFHEYRIDYLPGRVVFYADGRPLAAMRGGAVPASPGHLILQHWSNGNALWTGGPPAADAVLAVRYVKAYFNSSAPQRASDHAARCSDPAAPGAVCAVPDVADTATPNASAAAAAWFFSDQANMTNNQTVYSWQSGGGGLGLGRQRGWRWWPSAVAALLVCGWSAAL